MTAFGLGISTSTDADPVAAARNAERLGFDFVSASDHPSGDQPTYETWTMLSWIAAGTQRIGVATRVLGVPYRNPALTAKMAETFDRLSGGRLILGLGGGYSDAEFRAFGMAVPTPRQKVDGLAEAVSIIRGLWSEPKFSFPGRLHRAEAADLEPKPRRAIPIWLGTFGPRALEVTGRLADGWIPSLGYFPRAQLPLRRDRVLAAAEAAGRDPGSLTCALNLSVRINPAAGYEDGTVTGSVNAICEQLAGLIGCGFSVLNLQPTGPDQIEWLARDVLPALR